MEINVDPASSSPPPPGVPASSSPPPPAFPSRCIQVLLVVLPLSLLLSVGVLAAVRGLYASKSDEEFKSLKAQISNLTAKLTALKGKSCTEGWVSYGGKCYFFSTNLMNWTQSRDQCVSKGGHLVIINSQQEQEFLYLSTKNKTHWIGLNDLETEGRWLWVDKTPLKNTDAQFWHVRTNGELSEPDNWTVQDPSGEDCVVLGENYSNVWFDFSCKFVERFVCEKYP
ncbi:hypothetical protein DPEC_G00288700 [Dallia pectoralis]|uniref:Uncharacterized protein n=1 Tax=Dallia pectoralis TaxID=75939 RepID=A0ACC2FKI9_DALPE|nr:hypothetical protein DPEC_G00288700 [Dallia pectoralis]